MWGEGAAFEPLRPAQSGNRVSNRDRLALEFSQMHFTGIVRAGLWILGLCVVGLVALSGLIAVPQSPALAPNEAGALMSANPEFNTRGRLVTVAGTRRGADSMKHCCYSAEFTFWKNGATSAVPAHAEFRFFDGKWHLQEFSYGTPPTGESVFALQHDSFGLR